jgi:hypothetical protein
MLMRIEFADMRQDRALSEITIRRLKLAQAATACGCKDGKCSDCLDRQWAATQKRFQRMKRQR